MGGEDAPVVTQGEQGRFQIDVQKDDDDHCHLAHCLPLRQKGGGDHHPLVGGQTSQSGHQKVPEYHHQNHPGLDVT